MPHQLNGEHDEASLLGGYFITFSGKHQGTADIAADGPDMDMKRGQLLQKSLKGNAEKHQDEVRAHHLREGNNTLTHEAVIDGIMGPRAKRGMLYEGVCTAEPAAKEDSISAPGGAVTTFPHVEASISTCPLARTAVATPSPVAVSTSGDAMYSAPLVSTLYLPLPAAQAKYKCNISYASYTWKCEQPLSRTLFSFFSQFRFDTHTHSYSRPLFLYFFPPYSLTLLLTLLQFIFVSIMTLHSPRKHEHALSLKTLSFHGNNTFECTQQ